MLRIKADNEVHTVRDNRWGSSEWERSGGFLLRILILNKEGQNNKFGCLKHLLVLKGRVISLFAPACVLIPKLCMQKMLEISNIRIIQYHTRGGDIVLDISTAVTAQINKIS